MESRERDERKMLADGNKREGDETEEDEKEEEVKEGKKGKSSKCMWIKGIYL